MSKRTNTKDVFDIAAEEESDDGAVKTAPVEETSDEEADTVEEHPEEDGEEGGKRPSLRWRRGVAAVVVGVLVVALGASGFLGWRLKQIHEVMAAEQAALEAARNYAVVLTSLDSKDIDASYQQALSGATGEFKDAYSQGSAQLRQLLIDNNATGKGVVVDAAVKSATTNTVEVLLFVDQSITNAVNPSPRIDRNRVVMTMERVDGRWLASKVEIV